MIDEGTKVETDTTRTMDDTSFDAAFNDDTDVIATPESAGAADIPSEPVAGSAINDAEPPAVPESSALPDGYKLDSLGRLHGPDGRVVSKEEAAKLVPAAPTPPLNGAPPVAEVPKIEPPKEPEPYWVRASGQKTVIPNAFTNPDGSITIKAEGVQLHRDLLTQGIAHRASWPQEKQRYEQRVKDAESKGSVAGKKYNDASVFLFDKLANPDWFLGRIQSPEVRDAIASEWTREFGYIQRDVSHILKEADLSAPRIAEPAPVDDAQMEQMARSALAEEADDLLDTARDLFNDTERKELIEAFQQRINAYFVEHDGQTVLDRHALKRDFDREVAVQRRVKDTALKAADDARKAREAAAFNAATQPKPVAAKKPPTRPGLTPVGAKSPAQLFDEAWKDDSDD